MVFTRDPAPLLPVRSPRPGRRLVLTLAVILLLIGALWAARSLLGGVQPASPTSAPAASPTTVTGDACTAWPASRGYTDTTQVGGDVTWAVIGNVEAPSTAGVGPARTDPLRWCYAHTEAGALYAATNFVAQQGTVDPVTLATYLLADTPLRDRILTAAATSPPAPPPATPMLTWRGYHVVAYTDEAATFDVAHQWADQIVATTYTLVWEHGDWKVIYPTGLQFPQRIVPGLDVGYWTVWSSSR